MDFDIEFMINDLVPPPKTHFFTCTERFDQNCMSGGASDMNLSYSIILALATVFNALQPLMIINLRYRIWRIPPQTAIPISVSNPQS